MRLLHIKNLMHLPNRHAVTVKFEHMIHDERFWAFFIALLVLTAFIAIAIWAARFSGESTPEIPPVRPLYPMGL